LGNDAKGRITREKKRTLGKKTGVEKRLMPLEPEKKERIYQETSLGTV